MFFAGRTIQLQDPDVGNHERTETSVAFKTAMDGTIYGRRTSLRPQVLTYNFSALPRIKARELEDFVAAGAGKDVRLFDSDGQNWLVRFAVQSLQFVTTGHGAGIGVPEFVDVSISLEGSKL